jgi:hypothetical protein
MVSQLERMDFMFANDDSLRTNGNLDFEPIDLDVDFVGRHFVFLDLSKPGS